MEQRPQAVYQNRRTMQQICGRKYPCVMLSDNPQAVYQNRRTMQQICGRKYSRIKQVLLIDCDF
eukprot:scaffold2350_cov128-Amphora_coffeaeformis.AAC.1